MAAPGSDPVADFLAREHNDFAVLDEDENFASDFAPQPAQIMNGFGEQNGHNNLMDDGDLLNNSTATIGGGNTNADTASESTGLTPSYGLQTLRVEPEKIRKWREDQKNRLENKDAHEDIEKEKWRGNAKRELEEWYKNRVEQMEKTKKNNKISEQEFLKERDTDVPGQEWERITRLCEFNPKASKNTKDVSRMRTLLLQMKTQPTNQE